MARKESASIPAADTACSILFTESDISVTNQFQSERSECDTYFFGDSRMMLLSVIGFPLDFSDNIVPMFFQEVVELVIK